MLRTVLAFVVLAVGVAAQTFPTVQIQQLNPSCGGAVGFPFLAERSGLYTINFMMRGVVDGSGLLVIGLTQANVPIPPLPNFAPGCVAGVEPLVTLGVGSDTGAVIGRLPPPWGGSNPGFSPFVLGVPLYVQGIANCGDRDPNGVRAWCLTEAWSVTYWG